MTGSDKCKGVREQGRRETHARIFEAAREVFLEKGFDKGTVREIAARAGVGLGSVNLHFKDKTSLMHAVFYDEIERKSFAALESVPESPLDSQLEFLLEREYDFYGHGGAVFVHAVKASFFVGGRWGERYEEQADRYIRELAKLFDAARERGEIRGDADSEIAAMSCFSHYMFGIVVGVQVEPFSGERAMQAALPLVRQLVDALRTCAANTEAGHES
jgi:AcrR family transcriptional regulator